MISFGDLAKMLERSAAKCRAELEVDLTKVGALVQPLAAEYIGHELPEWAPLAASTVAEKERLGYVGQVSPTDPLLRTGAMRDSIKVEVEGLQMVVGSSDKKALWQEMGTLGSAGHGPIPPRHFLKPAMENSLPYAEEKLGETALKLLTPGAK